MVIKINNTEIKYSKYGNGKKAFVILPGISVTSIVDISDIVFKMYEKFTDEFTIYIFDKPINCDNDYSTFKMADDMVALFNKLKLSKVNIYGTSYGGTLAMTIAALYPNIVDKLAICSSSYYFCENGKNILLKWSEFAKNNDKINLSLEFAKNIYSHSVFEENIDNFIKQGEKFTESDLMNFIKTVNTAVQTNIFSILKNIKCKSLVICGKNDKIFPYTDSQLISNEINSKLIIYDDYGHGVYDEACDLIDKLYDFFI